ncbi:MAG: hypothetical protein ACXV8Y_17890, partial [Acidimicrobiia bacterium]
VIAPETKSLFEHTVGGSYSFVDLLVLSRPYAHLYYYLKEVYRMGRGSGSGSNPCLISLLRQCSSHC